METLVKELAKPYTESMAEHFRYLHEHAELSFQEYQTSAYIKTALQEFGIKIDTSFVDTTSVVGVLEGAAPGPTIAFRADMDALPIQEESNLPYASCTPGVMHACGHDSHVAVMLTLAQLLSERKDLIRGRVKFIFQSAEEKLPGGAKPLCAAGVMQDVDAIYAFHSASMYPAGIITSNAGPTSASLGKFEVRVYGKGGHVCTPHLTKNPLPTACTIINTLNQILGTAVDPIVPALFGVTYLHCGEKENIIADEAVFGGSIRSFDNATVDTLFEKLQQVCEHICAANGCTCDVRIAKGYPAAVNTLKEQVVVEQAVKLLGYQHLPTHLAMNGEDFAYYLLEKPGCICNIGMGNPDDMTDARPHHNSKFKLDEQGLIVALEVMLAVYLKAIEQ